TRGQCLSLNSRNRPLAGPLAHPKPAGSAGSPLFDRAAALAGSARRRSHPPVRVSRRVRVPEHDSVEIDCLGLRAPVTINAEPWLCIDERQSVAAGAIFVIGHGSLVGAAECAVKPNVDTAGGVMGGIKAYLHRGPDLPRQLAPADLRAHHSR